MKLTRFWEGYVTGTNRGVILIKIKQDGNTLNAKALFNDQEFNVSLAEFIGVLHGNHAELRLIRFHSHAPVVPLDGEIKIDFNEESHTATGTWSTDIGTSGNFSLRLVSRWRAHWHVRSILYRLISFWQRYAASIYIIGLLIVSIFSIFELCKINYATLILLLVPAPFLLKSQISNLIQIFRLRKAGPFEFETQIPPPAEDMRQFIGKEIEERLRFLILDGFFVPRTKAILFWLARNQPVTRSQFNTFASSIGVVPDNIQVTWEAILFSVCASYTEDKLTLSELGWRYINHLSLQGRPSQV